MTSLSAGATGFLLIESLLRLRFDALRIGPAAHRSCRPLALALPLAAIVARVLKSLDRRGDDRGLHVLMARAKGFSRARIVCREALRNALVPTVTLTGVQFTFLVGGTVLVEKIFSYPGIGNMAIDAVINRDLPLIQGLVLTFAVLFIAINLLVDMSYALLNPRTAPWLRRRSPTRSYPARPAVRFAGCWRTGGSCWAERRAPVLRVRRRLRAPVGAARPGGAGPAAAIHPRPSGRTRRQSPATCSAPTIWAGISCPG